MECSVLEASASAVDTLERWKCCFVHSVYRGTVNLTADGRELVALLAFGGFLHPYSVCLGQSVFHGVSAGSSCSLGGGRISLEGVGEVVYGAAPRIDCTLPQKERAPCAREVLRHLRARCLKYEVSSSLWFMVEERASDSRLVPFKSRIERFGWAARSGNVSEALPVAEYLLGLGWGLTPSFDDFMVGFLAVLWGCRALPEAAYHVLVSGLANVALKKTTLISANFVFHAAAGRFSKPVLNVFASLEDTDESLDRAVATLLVVGHSSGSDTLAGMLYGFTVLLTPKSF